MKTNKPKSSHPWRLQRGSFVDYSMEFECEEVPLRRASVFDRHEEVLSLFELPKIRLVAR